jgi:hypothetical protein
MTPAGPPYSAPPALAPEMIGNDRQDNGRPASYIFPVGSLLS